MRTRFLSALLVLCMVLTMMPTSALADELEVTTEQLEATAEELSDPESEALPVEPHDDRGLVRDTSTPIHGTCGENLRWILENGILTISGTGAMKSYTFGFDNTPNTPWYSSKDFITTVKIEDGVTSIGESAFYGCSSLTHITIPDSVTSIRGWAFCRCSALINIIIPDSVTSIENTVFADCSSLTSITIPNKVTSIWGSAFSNCSSLTSISIPNSITHIERSTFSDCKGLTSITIPDSVTSIGQEAFEGCSKLTDVYYSGTEEQWLAISINNAYLGNRYLLEASIHYNSTGPDTSLGDIRFDQGDSYTVEVGKTTSFPVIVPNPNGLTTDDITFTSSDEDVAVVSSKYDFDLSGIDLLSFMLYVEGRKAGTVTITAISKPDGRSASCTVTVKPGEATGDYDTFPVQTPIHKENEEFYYYGPFNSKPDKTTGDLPVGKYTYEYDETWFNKASTEYQHDLTRMSIRMAMAGFGDDTGKPSASANIEKLMKDLGFNGIDPHYYKPQRDSIGYIIGAKNIRTEDGTEYSLINVTLRGGGYDLEWGGNFQVGSDIEHENWTTAKDTVIQGIKEYMAKYGSQLFPNQKVWIQGYSRSSAVMNLVVKEMDLGNVEGITAPMQNIYAFGFEVPQSTRALDRGDVNKYGNIVNIANPIDLVTKVIPAGFSLTGYGRYGRTYYLPYQAGNKNYADLHDIMLDKLRDIAAMSDKKDEVDSRFNDLRGMAVSLDALSANLSTAFLFSSENYEKLVQKAMILLIDELMVHKNDMDGGELIEALIQGALSIDYLGKWYFNPVNVPGVWVDLVNPNSVILGLAVGYLVQNDFTMHYSELCMAWLDSLNGESLIDNSHLIYRRVFINCPVDVQVYDTAGVLVGKIVDGEVIEQEESNIYAYIDENDQMVLILPVDEEYRIEMAATDAGTVTYTATEYNMEDANTERVVSYYEVDVEKGDVLTGIAENLDNETAEYPLALNDEDLDATLNQSGDEVSKFTVAVTANGNGTANGGGLYVSGEFAKVLATPDDGADFEGWYIDKTLVSKELEYRFLVDKDISLIAVFTKTNDDPSATYTVVFNPNGGTLTGETTMTTDKNGKLSTLPTPTRDGYTFNGWYTALDGGKKVDGNYTYTADTTLYAHWTKTETPPEPSRPVDKEETYYISISKTDNGEIIPSTRYAEDGERVTLTAHPNAGYELDSISVTNVRGREITLRNWGNNRYSFTMPNSRVSVDASFTKIVDDTSDTPVEDEPFTGLGTPGISGIVLNPATMPFTDVNTNNWYYNSVDYVWKHYLMSGVSDTQFAPDATTSRAMIWTILARMNNVRTDVNPGSTWYERGMLWAMEQGVTDGSNAMGDITREQLATMLWRNAGSPGGTADLNQFSDSGSVSDYALPAVRWAVTNGILQGSDGKLNPKGTATRAQVAAMVMRYGERIGA